MNETRYVEHHAIFTRADDLSEATYKLTLRKIHWKLKVIKKDDGEYAVMLTWLEKLED